MMTFLLGLHKKYKRFQTQSDDVADSLLILNFERLSSVGYVAIPVHILHILLFWNSSTGTQREIVWRNGIILSHSFLMVFMVGLILVSSNLVVKRHTRKAMLITQWASLATILFGGVVIVTLDQLVTPNVTPFLVICTITAMVYLLRPIQAVFVYGAIFICYAWAIGLTQLDQAILLSNRVNGVTAIGIAIALSMILWRSATVTKSQENQLMLQKKELEEKNSTLKEYAFFDALTGLYNRRFFHEMMTKEQAQMQRDGAQAALLILDIDHFKHVNDKHGHPAGDMVLAKIGEILTTRLRKGDIVSRWGGEEFLCCLFNVKFSKIYDIAEGLKEAIAGTEFEQSLKKFTITVSIGISVLDPIHDLEFEQAYQNADQALYIAKSAGRNCIKVCKNIEKLLED